MTHTERDIYEDWDSFGMALRKTDDDVERIFFFFKSFFFAYTARRTTFLIK